MTKKIVKIRYSCYLTNFLHFKRGLKTSFLRKDLAMAMIEGRKNPIKRVA